MSTASPSSPPAAAGVVPRRRADSGSAEGRGRPAVEPVLAALAHLETLQW
jgi:hypothetical protein